jgi:hypothetical protein
MAFRPDLTGITINIDYGDGNVVVLDDHLSFPITPNWVFGFYDYNTGIWTPNYIYQMTIAGVTRTIDLTPGSPQNTGNVPTHGIMRSELEVRNENHVNPENPVGPTNFMFFHSGGLNVVGVNDMRQTYYFHDEPEFDGLVVEAMYTDGLVRRLDLGVLSNADLWTPGAPVQGLIHPLYDGSPRTTTGSGVLYTTIGRHPSYQPWRSPTDQLFNRDAGLTHVATLRNVHHVAKFDFATGAPPVLEPIFYWQGDSSANWSSRVPSDTMFTITFSNGTVITRDIDWLAEDAERVWWNENPAGDIVDMPDTEAPGGRDRALHIAGIQATSPNFHFFNNPNPRITFYFRGYRQYAPVNILTELVDVSVSPSSETVEFTRGSPDIPAWQDNDNIVEWERGSGISPTAQTFAGRLTVNANFRCRRDATVVRPVLLTYNHTLAVDNRAPTLAGSSSGLTGEGQPPTNMALGTATAAQQAARYTMNFGVNATPFLTGVETSDGSGGLLTGRTATQYRQFLEPNNNRNPGNWGLVDDPRNNGRTTRNQEVRIWYVAPAYTPGVGYNGVPFTQYARAASGSIPVAWSGID